MLSAGLAGVVLAAVPGHEALLRAAARVLEVPPPPSAPLLDVVASPQVELAAFVSALMRTTPLTLDTPPKVAAYANAGLLAQSASVQAGRQLLADGMPPEGLFRYLLMHTEPPALTLKARVAVDLVSPVELRILRERRTELKRFSDATRKLYATARLEPLLERYAGTLSSAVSSYSQVYGGGEPTLTLRTLVGEKDLEGGIALVPSLLAVEPTRFIMPTDDAAKPLRISVLPIGEDGAPSADLAAQAVYLEAAHWALQPLIHRYSRELHELTLGREPIEPQLVRGLYLARQGQRELESARNLRESSLRAGYTLVPAIEDALRRWETDAFPTLSRYMPELLERTQLTAEGKAELPHLLDPGFEVWDDRGPGAWRVEVVEPSKEASVRPSSVSRARGEERAGYALRLAGDRNTNEWQAVFSEPLPVLPGDHFRISARLRSRDVRTESRPVTAAHLEARVLNRDGAVLRRMVGRDLVGTTNWETVKLDFVAPGGADRLRIGVVLAMPGELLADDIQLEVERPELRRFIRNGGFETGPADPGARQGPPGWEAAVASRMSLSGPPVSSRWELDPVSPAEGETALKLTGDGLTSQWLEVRSIPVAVAAGQRVSLSGMTRAQGVSLEGRQHRHANLTITFLTASGAEIQTVESPALEGSVGWTPVEFEAVAPLEAVAVRVGCLLTMSGELWFDDLHLARR